MRLKSKKDPYEILEKLAIRARHRFAELAKDTTVADKNYQHRMSFKKAVDVVRSYQFLEYESIYAYSKELGLNLEDLKSELRRKSGSSRYLPDLSELIIPELSEDNPNIKPMLLRYLSVFPEFKKLIL